MYHHHIGTFRNIEVEAQFVEMCIISTEYQFLFCWFQLLWKHNLKYMYHNHIDTFKNKNVEAKFVEV